MRSFLSELAGWLVAIAVVTVVIIGWSYLRFQGYSFYASKIAEVQNRTFKESAAYNDGMQRDLELLMIEYRKSDETGKAIMRPVLIHRFSVYDVNRLSTEQQAFLTKIKESK
jgi:predicted Abi (CAAX) family protease